MGATLIVAWMAYALAEVARRERATTSRIVRYLADGVLMVTGEGRLAVVNPRAEHMVGVDASALVGMDVRDPANAAALAPLAGLLADVLAGPQGADTVCIRDVHIEEPTPLEVQCTTVPCAAEGGDVVAWVVVCTDITDVVSAVKARQRSLEVLSHEMRGRLHSLRISSEVLAGTVGVLTPERREKTLRLLDAETKRLVKLMGRILDAASVEDGSAIFEWAPVALDEVARQVCDSAQNLADEKHIALHLRVDGEIPAISGDSARLDEVLQNLVENAPKFTPEGGSVVVSVSAQAGEVMACVSDTGPGIPPKRRDLIFEKFVHGDQRSDALVGAGMGLGLFLCREIVRRHHGRIWADTADGGGAAICFAIPALEGGQPDVPPATELAAVQGD